MVTLTYRQAGDWSPEHMTRFVDRVRVWMKRLGHQLRYVWVAELQTRGAVHYHMLVWLPKGICLPKPDKRQWWTHGSTNVQLARRPVGYMVKYASKWDSKSDFPKGLRTHGAGGFDEAGRAVRHWWAQPGWIRAQAGVGERFCRVPGVGIVRRLTGEVVPSPWRFSLIDGTPHVREVFEYASPVAASGPYSRLEPVAFVPQEVAYH